ncbi:MAG: hypothetical protein P8N02_07370, partial [Actinomycetota bacterium]|nr:hypothetical protein [Actinomycetota bacterium]
QTLSLTEVTRRADIASATTYSYFASRDELVAAVAERELFAIVETYFLETDGRCPEWFRGLAEHLRHELSDRHHRRLFSTLLREFPPITDRPAGLIEKQLGIPLWRALAVVAAIGAIVE